MKNIQEPYLNNNIQDLDGEIWNSVINYDGYYEVSNLGRIKSIRRLTTKGYYTKEIIKKQQITFSSNHKRLIVSLSVDGLQISFLVSNLVANSFGIFANREKNEVIHHKNLNRLDNLLSNLCILSKSEVLSIYAQNGYMEHLHTNNIIKSANKLKITGIYDGDELIAKICTRCLMEKSLTDFPNDGRTYCKDCVARKDGVIEIGRNKNVKELKERGLRKCYKCQEIKKIDTDFSKNSSCCKGCSRLLAENKRILKKNMLSAIQL